ncbi:acyl-CoA dehydrogenase [Aliikangiella sp. IMCC44359]|uniref:acyl-CoA dehydrogenase n=1 Tax=Aliikangiella sp. IMCC44359 TaxID=3459125 RepID=UPI00403A8143
MSYQAPIEEMGFLLKHVFNVEQTLGQIDSFSDFDLELYSAVLEEAAKFSENVLFPINRNGDEVGCTFNNGFVTTPNGFKQAYKEYCEGGWQGTSGDPEYGGQGLPKTLHVLIEEMTFSANTSFCLYPSLTNGAYHAIRAHATDTIKATYLPPMLEGRWAGTMGLTEPHAGSDLGIIKTKAAKNENDTYSINGTKIFITGGEHDLSENIIHLVLAKLPDAPAGPKGISLFLVPKLKVKQDGSLGEANGVSCGSIEHKMGIKASATCVMNFDNAEGYLIGSENRGLNAMFTMMNLERLSIGIQGIGLSEMSYQLSRSYALERKQGKSESANLASIIEHADVRRMLLEQRCYTESARALAVFMGNQIDLQYHHSDETTRENAANLMSLLTPVAKAFFTDKGFDACNHGLQVLGGHGYIREWGLEQLVRDAKIAQIYEGTNGIQAQDLLVRKVCLDKQGIINLLYELIKEEIAKPTLIDEASLLQQQMIASLEIHESTSLWLIENFAERSYELQGGAVDYLHATGYLVYGWMWLKMLNSLESDLSPEFVARKKLAAVYFNQQILTNINQLCNKVKQGYKEVMSADNSLI